MVLLESVPVSGSIVTFVILVLHFGHLPRLVICHPQLTLVGTIILDITGLMSNTSQIPLKIMDSAAIDLSPKFELKPFWVKSESDQKLVEMWLHGRPLNTIKAYRSDAEQFHKFLEYVPLREITLEDVQRYVDNLQERSYSVRTLRRKINVVKSLFSFTSKLGYTPFNVTGAVKQRRSPTKLAQRILRQDEVRQLIEAEPNSRNRAFLKFLYATGTRVSEACQLTWREFQLVGHQHVQVYIMGKGDKDRYVIVPWSVWLELSALRQGKFETDLVFGFGRKNAHVIVKKAGERVGLDEVSCHWFRHAHALHSLKAGAPIHLVRDTLGHSSIAVTNVYLESMPEESSSKYLGL